MPQLSSADSEERELPIQVGGKNERPLHREKEPPADPTVQREMGMISLDTPLVSFDGGSYSRPDVSGAAGPNHYVQAVNYCSLMMFNKSGGLLLSTSITNLGVGCGGDPIVMYDKFADRWFIADGLNTLTVAVSQTPDPTGAYYIYNFPFPVITDFAKYSIWTDGYYVTLRYYGPDSVGVGVLERHKMLHGDASAGLILTTFPNTSLINANTQLPGCTKTLSCDGALPPYGKPNYLMYFTNINCGDATNSIMMYKLSTDTVLKKCKLAFDTSLAVSPFNAYFTGFTGLGAIAEPGGGNAWSLDGTFQYRVPYIRFTGYNSVVVCNTVNLGDSVAGIRWYELRQNDTTLKWSVYQQSTYGPNDSISRWNSSICMDLDGDISLAYDVTSKYHNLYPGIRYTGRLASDPMNQMTFAEQTAATGLTTYSTQWGDYAVSTLDPDGITFWHTNQYIRSASNPSTRIFSFRLASSLTGVSEVLNSPLDLKVFQSPGFLNVHVSGLSSNEPVVVTLFDLNGREIGSKWITPASRELESKINIKGLATDIYLVRVGNARFQKVVKVPIMN